MASKRIADLKLSNSNFEYITLYEISEVIDVNYVVCLSNDDEIKDHEFTDKEEALNFFHEKSREYITSKLKV
jgi:hypothetical protein